MLLNKTLTLLSGQGDLASEAIALPDSVLLQSLFTSVRFLRSTRVASFVYSFSLSCLSYVRVLKEMVGSTH